MHYRRAKTPGATYFFSVVTYNREHLLKHPETVQLLRQAFPDGADFSARWRLIKSDFTRHCPAQSKPARSFGSDTPPQTGLQFRVITPVFAGLSIST